jgi:hypothetical protein
MDEQLASMKRCEAITCRDFEIFDPIRSLILSSSAGMYYCYPKAVTFPSMERQRVDEE